MASLYERQDSRYWQAYIGGKREPTPFLKEGPNKRETKRLKREAQKWADRREERLRVEGPPFTVAENLEGARAEQEINKRKASTIDRGRVSGAHLGRLLGFDTNLNDIAKPSVLMERYVSVRRQEGATDHTISKEVAFFLMGLRRARRNADFTGNVEAFKVPALAGCYKPRSRWLPPHELVALLEAEQKSSERYSWCKSRRDWLLGYYFTGCRQNELHRIRKEHVDLVGRELFIDGTKTEKAQRTIPILDDLVEVIERRLDTSGPMLFAPEWQRGRMHANLKTWCAAAGIAPCSSNDFRRSYCTLLAERGVPEALAIDFLGHSSSRMVRTVYAQTTSRMRADTIRRFGSVLNSCGDEVTPIEKAHEYRSPERRRTPKALAK